MLYKFVSGFSLEMGRVLVTGKELGTGRIWMTGWVLSSFGQTNLSYEERYRWMEQMFQKCFRTSKRLNLSKCAKVINYGRYFALWQGHSIFGVS